MTFGLGVGKFFVFNIKSINVKRQLVEINPWKKHLDWVIELWNGIYWKVSGATIFLGTLLVTVKCRLSPGLSTLET